jgi:uncharacterized protein YyaL (SSP411 family)
LGAVVEKASPAFPRLLCAVDFQLGPPREVVLAGRPGAADFEALRGAVFASPGLNRILAHADSGADVPELSALTEGRAAGDPAKAYVCRNFACLAPVTDPAALSAALDA